MAKPPATVEGAVETLAAAKTATDLASAHRTARQAVSRARKAAGLGKLATAYTEAMQIMDAQKAAGVPFDERIKGLEQVLRAFWPHTREWHSLCVQCEDYGLVFHQCPGDQTCGRRAKPHLPHLYGMPCFCEKGRQFRDKPKPTGEDFAAAGKAKKGFSKVGR